MNTDLHIHTQFSCDSEADMELYVKKAIEDNIQAICFTDHVDMNVNDYGYNYYSADKYFKTLNLVKQKYGEQLKIYSGFEFGEPHLYFNKLNELLKLPYDYIIGSIHWVGDMFPCQKVREQYSAKEFYTLYWEEVLKTVKHGGFDALGHIDFPKRYYGEIYYEESKMNEIFKYLLEKDMVIEINTSSLRKGYTETMPGNEILEIYINNGGKYVTVGSDAHEVCDLASDVNIAEELIKKYGLQEVVFEGRNRKILNFLKNSI